MDAFFRCDVRARGNGKHPDADETRSGELFFKHTKKTTKSIMTEGQFGGRQWAEGSWETCSAVNASRKMLEKELKGLIRYEQFESD